MPKVEAPGHPGHPPPISNAVVNTYTFLFFFIFFRIVQCTDLHGYSGNGTFSDPYVSVTIQGPLSRYV